MRDGTFHTCVFVCVCVRMLFITSTLVPQLGITIRNNKSFKINFIFQCFFYCFSFVMT